MSVFDPFLKDIVGLSQLPAPELVALLGNPDLIVPEVQAAFSLLEDGTLDPGDLETIADTMWRQLKSQKTEALKKGVQHHRRLMPLYEYLECASEEEWATLARMMHDAEFEAQAPLFKILAANSGPMDPLDDLELTDNE